MRLLPERHDHGGGSALKDKPKPTDADINNAITNICRCGTFVQVRAAIHAAASA
jgi:isoquinoline 1-oxidoreductase subunit alpha